MSKRLPLLFALLFTLLLGSGIANAAHGEAPHECFDRVIFNNTWVVQKPKNTAGTVISDMHKLIKNPQLDTCDVESEHITFSFQISDGSYWTGEVLQGRSLVLYDDAGKIGAALVRFG